MHIRTVLGSLTLAIVLKNSVALAEDCPLKQISSIDMTVGPGGGFLVPVSINGTSQQMLLNTGGGITSFRQDAVSALGLHAIDASHIKLLSGNGTVSQYYAEVDFGLGNIRLPKLQAIVMPDTS